jgi:hypothetical protein
VPFKIVDFDYKTVAILLDNDVITKKIILPSSASEQYILLSLVVSVS